MRLIAKCTFVIMLRYCCLMSFWHNVSVRPIQATTYGRWSMVWHSRDPVAAALFTTG